MAVTTILIMVTTYVLLSSYQLHIKHQTLIFNSLFTHQSFLLASKA